LFRGGFFILPPIFMASRDTDYVLVKFHAGHTSSAANGFRNKHKLKDVVSAELAKIGYRKFKTDSGQAAAIAALGAADGDVLAIEADSEGYGFPVTPNDPLYSSQWHLTTIHADDAWDDMAGDPDVVIGVCDTGVQYDHPDLAINLIRGPSFVPGVSTSDDDHGHGTATTGTAVALFNNGLGGAGVAPKCRVRMCKILDSTNWGLFSWWASAIINQADYGVKVISLSCGGNNGSAALQSACQYARNKGVVVVAAAGNNGNTTPQYPAAYGNVISVSATDNADNLAGWSSRGYINIAAPGSTITTTNLGSGYATWSGTSFSCPIIAATVALIRSRNKNLSDVEAINVLYATADNLGNTTNFGVGRVNAYVAVFVAAGVTPVDDPVEVVAPSISITAPASGATVGGAIRIEATVGGTKLTTVTFKVDGATITAGIPVNGTTLAINWDTTGVADGSRVISLILSQIGGATATATRTVTVLNAVDSTAPTLTITNPSGNVSVGKKGILKIKATATDAISTPTIRTIINGVTVKTTTSTSSSYNWKYFRANVGANTVTVTATDAAGNVSTASRTVTKTA